MAHRKVTSIQRHNRTSLHIAILSDRSGQPCHLLNQLEYRSVRGMCQSPFVENLALDPLSPVAIKLEVVEISIETFLSSFFDESEEREVILMRSDFMPNVLLGPKTQSIGIIVRSRRSSKRRGSLKRWHIRRRPELKVADLRIALIDKTVFPESVAMM